MTSRTTVLFLAALLLAAPVLAGCLGIAGDDDAEQSVQKQRAQVDANAGGIQGIVTDEAIQPIEGANVTIVELDRTTQTASDGSFAFSLVAPGTYTVAVRDSAFVSQQQTAVVEENAVASIDFLVQRLAIQEAYMQQIEWSAFLECATGVGFNLSTAGGGTGGVTAATCTILNVRENVTNDDFLEYIELDPGLTGMVWEAQWDSDSGGGVAKNLWMSADVEGFVNTTGGDATVYQDISTPSPFRGVVNRSTFEDISANFTKRCENGEDRYCGYNFEDKGWSIGMRTFTAYDCQGTPADACAPTQLKVDHVVTAFYNQPVPEGFSVFGGGQ